MGAGRRAVRAHHRDRVHAGGDGTRARLTTAGLTGGDLAPRAPMQRLPQRMVSVASDREALEPPGRREAVEREAAALEGRGRVLVRPSATEPVVRLMVEARAEDECEDASGRLIVEAER